MWNAYMFPPCTLFNESAPKGMVQLTMTYRKYDSEWKLASTIQARHERSLAKLTDTDTMTTVTSSGRGYMIVRRFALAILFVLSLVEVTVCQQTKVSPNEALACRDPRPTQGRQRFQTTKRNIL